MFSSHGGHLTNAMYHHGETQNVSYQERLLSFRCRMFIFGTLVAYGLKIITKTFTMRFGAIG